MIRPNSSLICLALLGAPFLAGCGNEFGRQVEDVETDPRALEHAKSKDWSEHTLGLDFVIGYQAGLDQAREQNKPVMMFATTTWCGWCKRLSHECFRDDQVKELLSRFVLTIVDGDVEGEALTALGATGGFPHIVFVSPDGKVLSEWPGFATADQFKRVIKQALSNMPG